MRPVRFQDFKSVECFKSMGQKVSLQSLVGEKYMHHGNPVSGSYFHAKSIQKKSRERF